LLIEYGAAFTAIRSSDGKRLNIFKSTLLEGFRQFAEVPEEWLAFAQWLFDRPWRIYRQSHLLTASVTHK